MKRNQIFLLGLLLVLSLSISPSATENSASFAISKIDTKLESYDTHSPIIIISNSDFELQGFDGNGSQNNPYQIDFLEISSSLTCINISNVDSYFEISRCNLFSPSGRQGIGILLNNVSNGNINLCQISWKQRGISIVNSQNCNLSDSIIQNGQYSGISFDKSSNCWLTNISISNCIGDGLLIGNSEFIHADNFYSFGNVWSGINLYTSNNCTFEYCTLYDNSQAGVLLSYSRDCQFSSCTFNGNNGIGIHIRYESDRIRISDSIVNSNSGNGIHIEYSSDFIQIINTDIQNNIGCGVYLNNSFGGRVTNCLVYDNQNYGIFLDSGSWGNLVINNQIGWNSHSNAYDSGQSNYWSAIPNVGNYWSGIQANGEVTIPGDSHSIDYYARTIFTLDDPPNPTYELDTGEFLIIWHAFSLHPSSYRIYNNGVQIKSGVWNGNDVTIEIQNPGLGVSNFTLVLVDTYNHILSDTVFVTITDSVLPLINPVMDMFYMEGITGNYIIWTVYDSSPSSYQILRNGVIIRSGGWDGSSIEISVDGLLPGIYTYQLIVTDGANNSAIDTVIVTVGGDSSRNSIDYFFSPVLGGVLVLAGSIILSLSILSTKFDVPKVFKRKQKEVIEGTKED